MQEMNQAYGLNCLYSRWPEDQGRLCKGGDIWAGSYEWIGFHPLHKGRKSSQQRGSKCQGREARKSLAHLGNPEWSCMIGMWRGVWGFRGAAVNLETREGCKAREKGTLIKHSKYFLIKQKNKYFKIPKRKQPSRQRNQPRHWMGYEWSQHIHKTVRPGVGRFLRDDYTSRGQTWPCDPEGNIWGGGMEEKKQTVRLYLKDIIPELSITPISQVQKLRLRGSHSDWCWVQIITSPWLPPSHIHTKYKQLRTA